MLTSGFVTIDGLMSVLWPRRAMWRDGEVARAAEGGRGRGAMPGGVPGPPRDGPRWLRRVRIALFGVGVCGGRGGGGARPRFFAFASFRAKGVTAYQQVIPCFCSRGLGPEVNEVHS